MDLPKAPLNQDQNYSATPDVSLTEPVKPKGNNYLIMITIILVVLILSAVSIFLLNNKNLNKNNTPIPPAAKTLQQSSTANRNKTEVAIHTFFDKGQQITTLKEENRHYGDGILYTIITKGNQTLSRQLFLPNMILQFSNGFITGQRFKASSDKTLVYHSSSENILEYVKKNLRPVISNTNGEEMEVYTIGKQEVSLIPFIRTVFAVGNSDVVKVYVEKTTGDIKKVERLDPVTSQQMEVIDYQILPLPVVPKVSTLPSPSVAISAVPLQTPSLSPISSDVQLKAMKEKLLNDLSQEEMIKQAGAQLPVLAVVNEMEKETTSFKVQNVQPPVIPDGAIYLEPLSVIPTASSYNSPVMMLTSKVFNQQSAVEIAQKEKGVFNNLEFAKNNVKIRVDGSEIQNSDINLSNRDNNNLTSLTAPWTVTSLIPKGLAPGYHTLEVYMVNSWYLAPSLLVALPKPDEKVAELSLSFNIPPKAILMLDNQNYSITLHGKNFSKPLSVYLDNTLLDDSNVTISSSEELTLIIPATIASPAHGPAYDLTIVKDGQKIVKPSFLLVGAPINSP